MASILALLLSLSAAFPAMADSRYKEIEREAQSLVQEFIAGWDAPATIDDTLVWARAQHEAPTDPLYAKLKDFTQRIDLVAGIQMANVVKHFGPDDNLSEEQQRRSVHLAVVLARDFTPMVLGMPNAGKRAFEHLLCRSRFPSVRLLAAQASTRFREIRGSTNESIYYQTVQILVGAYHHENDEAVKTLLGQILTNQYKVSLFIVEQKGRWRSLLETCVGLLGIFGVPQVPLSSEYYAKNL